MTEFNASGVDNVPATSSVIKVLIDTADIVVTLSSPAVG